MQTRNSASPGRQPCQVLHAVQPRHAAAVTVGQTQARFRVMRQLRCATDTRAFGGCAVAVHGFGASKRICFTPCCMYTEAQEEMTAANCSLRHHHPAGLAA